MPGLRRWSGHRKERGSEFEFDGYALRNLVQLGPGGASWEYFGVELPKASRTKPNLSGGEL